MDSFLEALVAEAYREFIKKLEVSMESSRAECGQSPVSKPNCYLHIYLLSYSVSNSPLVILNSSKGLGLWRLLLVDRLDLSLELMLVILIKGYSL